MTLNTLFSFLSSHRETKRWIFGKYGLILSVKGPNWKKWHYYVYSIQILYCSTSQDCFCSFQKKKHVSNLKEIFL